MLIVGFPCLSPEILAIRPVLSRVYRVYIWHRSRCSKKLAGTAARELNGLYRTSQGGIACTSDGVAHV